MYRLTGHVVVAQSLGMNGKISFGGTILAILTSSSIGSVMLFDRNVEPTIAAKYAEMMMLIEATV